MFLPYLSSLPISSSPSCPPSLRFPILSPCSIAITAPRRIVLHRTASQCIAVHCIALHCSVLYCIAVPHCAAVQQCITAPAVPVFHFLHGRPPLNLQPSLLISILCPSILFCCLLFYPHLSSSIPFYSISFPSILFSSGCGCISETGAIVFYLILFCLSISYRIASHRITSHRISL